MVLTKTPGTVVRTSGNNTENVFIILVSTAAKLFGKELIVDTISGVICTKNNSDFYILIPCISIIIKYIYDTK